MNKSYLLVPWKVNNNISLRFFTHNNTSFSGLFIWHYGNLPTVKISYLLYTWYFCVFIIPFDFVKCPWNKLVPINTYSALQMYGTSNSFVFGFFGFETFEFGFTSGWVKQHKACHCLFEVWMTGVPCCPGVPC